MDLSTIVINWNTKEYLAECLSSVTGSQPGLSDTPAAAAGFRPARADLRLALTRSEWGAGPLPAPGEITGEGNPGIAATNPRIAGASPGIAAASPGIAAANPRIAAASPGIAGISVSTAPKPLDVEVIVVDNASSDGSAPMVRELFPWVRLIANAENVGFARANNQAIRRSQGRYILLLNSDTEVYEGALEAMVAFMDAHPQAAGCGPRLLNADGTLQPSCYPVLTPDREFWRLIFLDRVWRRATYDQTRWDPATPRQVEVIKGACLLLRREALEQVGLLDEQYFVYTEEMDLCYRLLQAGWELWWTPDAVVKHYGEASSRQIAEDMYVQLYLSKVQFHRKFGGERQVKRFKQFVRWAYRPRLLAMYALRIGVPRLDARARTYARLLDELPGM